ncbi:transglutaminase family protein [Actinophytocola gossypii]|uniref:Transglutaminase domain-containing protein n=1 Tax=Actinophytocola gossypii TaxID=2812003 RepID=A0ABT2JDF5_9PSEU|nr:transglutaminase domain-containing protein [Actinophytocola gossypii]MCT2585907.1 transglutaminase domain-containing protein [Actinophytocola gossypii]
MSTGTSTRIGLALVVLAAVAPGLLFEPVFGFAALVLPLAVVAVVAYAAAELALRRPGLVPWRALLALVAGLLGLVETTLRDTTAAGLPTAETLRMFATGVTDSWRQTLQSTWPARPDPELLLFVPLAALGAAVVAVELMARLRRPLVALLPGFVVLVLSQAYVALTGVTATAAGLGFAALAVALLVVTRTPAGPEPTRTTGRRGVATALMVVPALVLTVAGAALLGALDPVERPAYSLRENQEAPLPPGRMTSPLDDIADRMTNPDVEVFRYTTDDPVEYWRLCVLDEFDGASWQVDAQFLRMGSELTPPPGVGEVTRNQADVRVTGLDGQWVPSQAMPASVTGLAPRIGEDSGTLVVPAHEGPVEYDLSWWATTPTREQLRGAGIDRDVPVGGVGTPPEAVVKLAQRAVSRMRPSFEAALLLEDFFLKGNRFEAVKDGELPTGNGWHQLERFLTDTRIGTSEQFATAYVLMARILGIPARVAVGFRAPEPAADGATVVHNDDVLAWPEVAVEDVGWVPLDPTGQASGTGGGSALAEATAGARDNLPPRNEVVEPDVPEEDDASGAAPVGGPSFPLIALTVVVGAVLVLRLAGVPLARGVRAWRRRHRRGAGAVVGAWEEARDRLRAYRVPITVGMTVRDLAGTVPEPLVVDNLHTLARGVDLALWSPTGAGQTTTTEAWLAVREVRRGLARRGFGARLRAALHVPSLFRPR